MNSMLLKPMALLASQTSPLLSFGSQYKTCGVGVRQLYLVVYDKLVLSIEELRNGDYRKMSIHLDSDTKMCYVTTKEREIFSSEYCLLVYLRVLNLRNIAKKRSVKQPFRVFIRKDSMLFVSVHILKPSYTFIYIRDKKHFLPSASC